MNDDDLMAEAAQDLRRSLNPNLEAGRRGAEAKARRRRRSRRLMSGGVALVIVVAVAMVVSAVQGPASQNVVAGPRDGSEEVDPGPAPTPSTQLPTTSVPPTSVPPVTETMVVRVETLVGDIFELTVPRTPAFAQPRISLQPFPFPPGTVFDVTVEPGSGEQKAEAFCRNPIGPPGCVPTEEADLGDGNTFVRWRFTRPDGSLQGGSSPELSTLSNGEWTLVIQDPDPEEARRIAEGLTISTSDTGGPRLTYADPALRSEPYFRGDVRLTFSEHPDDIPVDVSLSHDCSSLRDPEPGNYPDRECIDGVGVSIGGDQTLESQLRSVLEITRVAE